MRGLSLGSRQVMRGFRNAEADTLTAWRAHVGVPDRGISSDLLGCGPFVVLEQSAEAFTTDHFPRSGRRIQSLRRL